MAVLFFVLGVGAYYTITRGFGHVPLARANVGASDSGHSNKAVHSVTSRDSTLVETVMTVGSSVAEGWVDPKGGGYLNRAFRELSLATKVSYKIARKAVAGDYTTKVARQFPMWLREVHPQVVVISWGALDDIEAKTPIATFEQNVRMEISQALAAHSVVVIVTTPITRATYTQFQTLEPRYMNAEMAAARSFHSPNVVISDVFNQMKSYIAAHHQTYKPYMADGWHPNAAGHALAGQLLYVDLLRTFGVKPISFSA